jgi:crotonobetainyl-CoA:carnitine CoA-transferase CaiB-like acyl-CoA transferase
MPLSRLTVVDLATLGAAPQVAAFFGDFGARVIKVEPPGGDGLRRLVDARGTALTWKVVNRSKECVTLDVARPEGRALLDRMLERADLLVANLPRERLARFGLEREALAARYPRLVVVNLTAWGTTGPWAERPGSGTLAEAASGLAALTGAADGPPTLSPVGLGDWLGVLQGIVAALLALYARDAAAPGDAGGAASVAGAGAAAAGVGAGGAVASRAAGGAVAGGGELLDVAMLEPLLGLLSTRIAGAVRDGADPGRHGNRFPNVAPRNAYRAADGRWVALTAGTDDLARRLLAAIGRPELAADPRFASNRARVAHADELDAIVGGWIAARACDEVVETLCAARVSAAAIDGPLAVARNPHLRARAALVEVDDAEAGALTLAAPSPARAAQPGRVRWLGRPLGTDNDAVYRGWLGLSAAELEGLRAAGIV